MARPPIPVGIRPYRVHLQNLQERLMPRAQFEARERVRQARRERGIDSDKSTIQDEDEDDGDDGDDT
jgi:hypothetical protein